jgi:hypothetical protein
VSKCHRYEDFVGLNIWGHNSVGVMCVRLVRWGHSDFGMEKGTRARESTIGCLKSSDGERARLSKRSE